MYKTSTEDVYTLVAMSAEDIRDAGTYAVGTVSTSNYTSPSKYVEVRNYTTAGVTDKYTQSDLTDSSKLYTLTYNSVNYGTAVLAEDDASVVLNEKGDANLAGTAATNKLLVSRDSKGNVIYAVSFDNYQTVTNAAGVKVDGYDYAQYVYGNVLPAKIGAPVVTFYGETATADGTTTVTYAKAVANLAAGAEGLTVSGGSYVLTDSTGSKIADVAATPDNTTATTYFLTVRGDNGNSYTYVLKVDKGRRGSDLLYKADNAAVDRTGSSTGDFPYDVDTVAID
jgi:hypothetical protein